MSIDITPNMIDEANQLAESLNSDATFSVMDAENLSLDTNTFYIVVARNVQHGIYHIQIKPMLNGYVSSVLVD